MTNLAPACPLDAQIAAQNPEMTDASFVEGAIEALSMEVATAAGACLMAQNIRRRRVKPKEVIALCRSLGLKKWPDFVPVLALLGWLPSVETRRNRYIFVDLFCLPHPATTLPTMGQNDALARGIVWTLLKKEFRQ